MSGPRPLDRGARITSAESGTYRLSVTELQYADDYTADTGTAASIAVGGAATGNLEHGRDRDWFAVTLEAGIAYRIDVKGYFGADYGGTLLDSRLAVFDSAGDAIDGAANDNGGVGANARLASFTPETSGTYYLQVSAGGSYGGTRHVHGVGGECGRPVTPVVGLPHADPGHTNDNAGYSLNARVASRHPSPPLVISGPRPLDRGRANHIRASLVIRISHLV